jgi:hypothetical protein
MPATIETTGEFAGWTTWKDEPFEHETAGPFYYRVEDGKGVSAFRAARKHMNGAGVLPDDLCRFRPVRHRA